MRNYICCNYLSIGELNTLDSTIYVWKATN